MARIFWSNQIMKPKDPSRIVPNQRTGISINAESTIELTDERDAKAFFSDVKERLQNVNHWKEYAGDLSATFQVVDKEGLEVQRKAQKGDYFKIDIPGPGSKTGHGYDWVQVEEVLSTSTRFSESFGFRVRPTENPQGNKEDIAHFYSQASTSSFVVERNRNKITASVHDRNIKPNTDADRTSDKIRDAVIGVAGAVSFSKIQWKSLTEGLLKK